MCSIVPDSRTPANYRGIALQSVVFKVLCKVLIAKLSDWQWRRKIVELRGAEVKQGGMQLASMFQPR